MRGRKPRYMNKSSKIYVAGHTGLVGSAILRALNKDGYDNIITRTHAELDLLSQKATAEFFAKELPEYVFLAAAKAGGIYANSTCPTDFICENLLIEINVISESYRNKVKKLLFLGSSCIYPRESPQPMKEAYLLTGKPEPTNDAYAVAKIAGIMLCQSYNKQHGTNFISVMPTNVYGPQDNFDLETSHALPAIMRKIHEAKITNQPTVTLWGTGTPKREFIHADDLAAACVFLMNNYDSSEIINIGTGSDLAIRDLAEMMKKNIGYEGEILWDTAKPDGMPRKLLDISRLRALGWEPKIKLQEGIMRTYQWFMNAKI